MVELVNEIVSLVHLAWQTCKAAQQHKQECLRLGERLMNLMVLTQEWEKSQTRQENHSRLPSHTVLRSLEKVLTRLNVILQAANLPKKRWTTRVKRFVDSRDILDELLVAERDLSSVLQDCQFHQGSALFQHSSEHFHRIEQMLMHLVATNQKATAAASRKSVDAGHILAFLAAQEDPTDPTAQTFQQQIDHLLKECQTSPAAKLEDAVDSEMLTSSSSTTTMTVAASTSVSASAFSMSSSSSISLSASGGAGEILVDLDLDLKQLQCSFGAQDLIGEGSFSQVFRAVYQGNEVAIKQLKIHQVDLVKMSEREKSRQIRRIQAEAVVMSRACIHPNITQLLGCRAVLNETERPLLAMELMDTNLFMALHQGKIPSFSKRLDLLKGVASALEFLHIRGIVHQDIKSKNILLTKGFDAAKLADFGEAKEKGFATTHAMTTISMSSTAGGRSGSTSSGGASGTMNYQAPEVLVQHVKEVSRKAEIHTMGVVIWECTTGEIPHQGKGPLELMLLAQNKETPCMLDVPHQSPAALRDSADILAWQTLCNAAKACLSRDAVNRPTASEVVAALSEGPSHVFQSTGITPRPQARITQNQISHARPPVVITNQTIVRPEKHQELLEEEAQQPGVPAGGPFCEENDEPPCAAEQEEQPTFRMPAIIRKHAAITGVLCSLLLLGAGIGVALSSSSKQTPSEGREGVSGVPTSPTDPHPTSAPAVSMTAPPIPSTVVVFSSWTQVGSTLTGVAAGDRFGKDNALALSADGTILAVGASRNDDVASDAGRVQVFQQSGGTGQAAEWQPIGAVLTGVVAGDEFGDSVALSSNGQILAVGASEYSADGPGYVRVFEYDSINDQWNPRGSEIVGVAARDRFGSSVALSFDGNTLAVGAPYNDDNGDYVGHARVFAFNSNSKEWVQQGSTLTGVAEFDFFGSSLDLSGDGAILAAGAVLNDDNGESSGHVRAFQFNSNSNDWDPLGEAIPGVAQDDEFGTSVALSSNGMVLAAGADGNDDNVIDSGHVRVFDYDTSTNEWIQRGSAMVGVAVGDQFGSSVALAADGNQVASGAIWHSDFAASSGHVRVFQFEPSSDGTSTSGQWKQVGGALTGVGGRSDEFGRSVAMSADGSVVAGGADESWADFEGPGYVCVYEGVVE